MGESMKYIGVIATGMLICACLAFQKPQDANTVVKNPTIIVAKGDREAKWVEQVLKETDIEDLRKLAKENGCSVVEEGINVFVIDEAAFGIKRLRTVSSALSEIAKNGMGMYSALDPNSYSEATFNYFLQCQTDNQYFKNAYEKGNARLFFTPCINFTFSGNGKTLTVANNPGDVKMDEASLASSYDDKTSTKLRQYPPVDKSLWEVGQGLKAITVLFGGRERSLYNKAVLTQKAMKYVSNMLDTLDKQNDDLSINIAEQLMQKYHDDIWGQNTAVGTKSGKFGDLSSRMQGLLQAQVTSSYKDYGFASEAEALTFLRSSSISSARIDLSVSSLSGRGANRIQVDVVIPTGK